MDYPHGKSIVLHGAYVLGLRVSSTSAQNHHTKVNLILAFTTLAHNFNFCPTMNDGSMERCVC